MTRPSAALLVVLVAFGGCGHGSDSSSAPPLGRTLTAGPASLSPAPAPTGDPPQERNGTVPEGQADAENGTRSDSRARTPQAALLQFALAYINWQAVSLSVHERELASLAVGAARLAAQQTAASESAAGALAADHVANKGVVLAIAPGKGRARGQWVVVTQEETTGTGPYAGLPSSAHVTVARTARVHARWVVNEWRPES